MWEDRKGRTIKVGDVLINEKPRTFFPAKIVVTKIYEDFRLYFTDITEPGQKDSGSFGFQTTTAQCYEIYTPREFEWMDTWQEN